VRGQLRISVTRGSRRSRGSAKTTKRRSGAYAEKATTVGRVHVFSCVEVRSSSTA
jgi:hypothetical protein